MPTSEEAPENRNGDRENPPGRMIAEFEGVQVFADLKEPRRNGKRRLTFTFRQGERYWRLGASASWPYTAWVRFEA